LLKVKDAGCEVLLVEGYFPDYVVAQSADQNLNLPVKAYGCMGHYAGICQELNNGEYIYGTSIWEMGTALKERAEEAELLPLYSQI
jgi:delta-aminolevulinic acid dehydratase/porphobilinogen synthase